MSYLDEVLWYCELLPIYEMDQMIVAMKVAQNGAKWNKMEQRGYKKLDAYQAK